MRTTGQKSRRPLPTQGGFKGPFEFVITRGKQLAITGVKNGKRQVAWFQEPDYEDWTGQFPGSAQKAAMAPKTVQTRDQESLENELRDLRRSVVRKYKTNAEVMALWDETMNLKSKIEEVKVSGNKAAVQAARKTYEESLTKIDLLLFQLDSPYKAFYDEVYGK